MGIAVARHLLSPRLNDAIVIPVETVNSHEHGAESVRGNQFSSLLEAMAGIDGSIIIDVGASNIEPLLNGMNKIVDSHEDFDFFITPTVAKKKTTN